MNFQGGDNNLSRNFYKIVLDYIKNGQKILNLGCGILFNFEKVVFENKNIKSTSIDVIDIQELNIKKPYFIDNFLVMSVENSFILENKFDVVTFFELIEHVDNTDVLLENCFNNLKDDGLLIFSFPNLASVYARIELLFGFQPHILEVSNVKANFGAGIFGKLNNSKNVPLHHIRGITNRAMREMLDFNNFKIVKIIGYEYRFKRLFRFFPSFAPVNIVICKKK
ncbi:MAG: methyltransferase domain-containing protein [Patescibacteria group bacterium]